MIGVENESYVNVSFITVKSMFLCLFLNVSQTEPLKIRWSLIFGNIIWYVILQYHFL